MYRECDLCTAPLQIEDDRHVYNGKGKLLKNIYVNRSKKLGGDHYNEFRIVKLKRAIACDWCFEESLKRQVGLKKAYK